MEIIMNKLILFLFSLQIINNAYAANLTLFTDKSRATGEVRIYIQNTGTEEQTVLTKNLTFMGAENEITISPDRHVLVKDDVMITLKEDIAFYGAVSLKPGETTYVRRPVIDIKSGTIKYKIRKPWAKMHGLWNGTIATTF